MSLSEQDREALSDAVYDFLVTEGYHGHYPSAEEQAEKFTAADLGAAVEAIVARHVAEALEEAAAEVEADMNHDACRNATLATAARIVRSRKP